MSFLFFDSVVNLFCEFVFIFVFKILDDVVLRKIVIFVWIEKEGIFGDRFVFTIFFFLYRGICVFVFRGRDENEECIFEGEV